MPAEWKSTCKDCGKEFGYSDSSHRASIARGMSRPERCPNCRRLHSREIASVGMSHYELQPIVPLPDQVLPQGTLGGLRRAPRKLIQVSKEASFDLTKFGIKDEHMCEYCALAMSQRHQVMVVVAPTGSGKSTFFPYRLMVPPLGRPDDRKFAGLSAQEIPADLFTRYGQIIVTQPRIQATRNIPAFVAEKLHGSTLGAGFDVGYQHSGNMATDWRNKLVYMTDGTLINIIVRNELHRVGVIVIDEAHERSINIDLILGLLKRQLPLYPHLRVVIASATIDSSLFMRYFGGPADFNPDAYKSMTQDGDEYDNKKIMDVLAHSPVGFYGFPGKRQFPVETRFWDGEAVPEKQFSMRMPEMVANKVVEILDQMESKQEKQSGDILAFLQGKAPIEQAVSLIRDRLEADSPALYRKVDVLPLYTELPQAEQDKALQPKKDNRRFRVVISTNVAETSLTVDGIVHVVDSGLINESQWNAETQTTSVMPKLHSQAGCKQRWGRGGRIQAGVAHCLYTEEQFNRLFPAHTTPEIVRSPIDQIVLTAKAAGIRDLKNFDWIQRPAEIELDRAPHYLQQVGALDADGDLTDHGNELRNFADETEIANLMVLADRFGCAAEMALLLAMRKLGGYLALFEWQREWDIYTKHQVSLIQQGLFATCIDDVEFYIKLWSCWLNAADKQEWCKRHFVRQHVLQNVQADSEKLLQGLLSKTKFEKVRGVERALITRVRIVLTYGLPNQIYHLANQATLTTKDAPEYRPEPTVAMLTHVQAMHEKAIVSIDSASICYGKHIPLFVCGSRKQRIRKVSPITEPIPFITTSFLSIVQREWLECIGMSHMQLARFIAKHTRQGSGQLLITADDHLYVDQKIPIGTVIDGVIQSDGRMSDVIITPISLPAKIEERWNNQDAVIVDDIEEVDASGALAAALSDIVISDDEDISIADFDTLQQGDDEETPDTNIPVKSPQIPAFQYEIRVKYPTTMSTVRVSTEVIGYAVASSGQPVVLVRVRPKQDIIDTFNSRFKVDTQINVQLLEVREFAAERMHYVLTRQPQSDIEVIMEAADCTFSRSSAGIHALRSAPLGSKFLVNILNVYHSSQTIRVSWLSFYEQIMDKFRIQITTLVKMPDGSEQLNNVFDGLIVDSFDHGVNVWIDDTKTMNYMPLIGYAHASRLPARPNDMMVGKKCRVRVTPRDLNRNPVRVALNLNELSVVEKQRFLDAVKPYWQNNQLETRVPINYETWRVLARCSQNLSVLRRIGKFVRDSHQFNADVIDMVGLQHLNMCQLDSRPVQAQIVNVQQEGVNILTEAGYSAYIPQYFATYNTRQPLEQQFMPNTQVTVFINQIDLDQGKAKLTLRDKSKHPFLRYTVGQLVFGVVRSIPKTPYLMLVEIAEDVNARLHIREASTRFCKDFTEAQIIAGSKIQVQVTKIDIENDSMDVSVRACYAKNYRAYVLGKKVRGTVVQWDDNFVTLELESNVYGSMHKSEVSLLKDNISFSTTGWVKGRTSIEAIVTGLDENEFKIELSARALGRTGEFDLSSLNKSVCRVVYDRIKAILPNSGVHIFCDYKSNIIKITSSDASIEDYWRSTIRQIEVHQGRFSVAQKHGRKIIGSQGATVQKLRNDYHVQISVEDDDVSIFADSKQNIERAFRAISTDAIAIITTQIKYEILTPIRNVPYKETTPPLELGTHIKASVQSTMPVPPSQQVPNKVTERLALTANHLMRLQKAPGGFFSFFRTAPIDRIQADTGTSITVMPNNIIVIAGLPFAVAAAKKMIKDIN